MLFILNNSDAPVYIHQGSGKIPSADAWDLMIPPVSFDIFDPHGGWQYGAFMDNPSAKDCFITFLYGYTDLYRRIKESEHDWQWWLPGLIYPAPIWGMKAAIFPPTANFSFLVL